MESALIVSYTEKSTAYFAAQLRAASVAYVAAKATCAEAKRLLTERDFDLVIINAPLADESGELFAKQTARDGAAQVILVVKAEGFAAAKNACEGDGVLTVSKPLNNEVFLSALSLAKTTHRKVNRMRAENARLIQKIEDIRIVDRAKCILISHMKMSETEAHKYIEKQAMDMRSPKRAVAEGIIRTYEN